MRSFTVNSLNPAVRNVQYAVRGELAIKAEEYRVILKEKGQDSGLPFDRVISSNIGNPQQKGLDQPPITFNRQVSFILYFYPLKVAGVPEAFLTTVTGCCTHGVATADATRTQYVSTRRH
jgi:alanine transaminase